MIHGPLVQPECQLSKVSASSHRLFDGHATRILKYVRRLRKIVN